MLNDIFIFLVGFVLIAKGGDFFVDSSVQIANRLRVPRIVIGATLVSFATTVPELMVSSMASVVGDSGIALGNAMGSAIANIGLIVGVTALIMTIKVDLEDFNRRSLWMLVSAGLVALFTFDLRMSLWEGVVILLLAVGYLAVDLLQIKKHQANHFAKKDEQGSEEQVPALSKTILFFLIGVVMVVVGSKLLVSSGQAIAAALGVPSIIIGLSIIAIGTSLPELVTGVSAALKGVPDLSIGNIVGANVLNLALITGVSAIIHPLELIRFTQLYSLPWLFVFIGMMIFIFKTKKQITKSGGIILLAAYLLYILGLILIPKML